MEKFADLYTAYWISPTSLTTSTGRSRLLQGRISQDKIPCHLSNDNSASRYLWKRVKPMIQKRSSKTKNELYRDMLLHCDSTVHFDYVLNDSWYSSAENMAYIKRELKQNFIMAIKYNRKEAMSKQEKKYRGISSLKAEQQPMEVWLEEIDFPLLLTKQVFKNEDGTEGVLFLVCSELSPLSCPYQHM